MLPILHGKSNSMSTNCVKQKNNETSLHVTWTKLTQKKAGTYTSACSRIRSSIEDIASPAPPALSLRKLVSSQNITRPLQRENTHSRIHRANTHVLWVWVWRFVSMSVRIYGHWHIRKKTNKQTNKNLHLSNCSRKPSGEAQIISDLYRSENKLILCLVNLMPKQKLSSTFPPKIS